MSIDGDPARTDDGPARVLIVGGGIAGLEALMALRDLAGDRVELTLVAPVPEFTYKPLTVEEPFSSVVAERHELQPWAAEFGASFVRGAVERVHPDDHTVELEDGARLSYDILVVCMGARTQTAFQNAVTFRASGESLSVDDVLARGIADESRTVAFVVPPGVSWPLPLYELALMTRRRAEESGRGDVRLVLITPESGPLIMFGRTASDAVAGLLRARRIEFQSSTHVRQNEDAELILIPGGRRLEAGAVVALPMLDGPNLAGLPADERGFIPIDGHARVPGVDDVYAAGDGTTFPIKQGGLGTQQADAAAAHIAARLGAQVDSDVFHPVLRGQLITGAESLHLRHDLTGGHGESAASPDYLWWPPHKVGGRYLSAYLAHEQPRADLEPPSHPLEVEVAIPHEWHENPMALDPYEPLDADTWASKGSSDR
jgi:sulfide:quinone oxidoreductase